MGSETKESFKPFYSQRKKIANEAVEYLKNEGADPFNPTNIISALSALGYLKEKE